MKYKKIIIYKRDAALYGKYFYRNAQRYALVIGPCADEPNKDKYLFLLRKMICTLLSYQFSVLYLPLRYVGERAKNQDNLNDILEAVDWLADQHQDADTGWIAGIGYGGYLSVNVAMRRPRLNGFISASSIFNKDFSVSSLTPCPSGLMVHGEDDHFSEYSFIEELASSLITYKSGQINFELIENANHFYDDHVDMLESVLNMYIQKRMHIPSYQKASIAV